METKTQDPADFLADVVMTAWKNDMTSRGIVLEVPAETVVAVDADCPDCGWPERTYDTGTRRFGCIRCDYTSDERNA